MSYFLTDIAKEKGITIRDWCEGVNVADSTARWHLKAKRIPDPKCWKRISKFLIHSSRLKKSMATTPVRFSAAWTLQNNPTVFFNLAGPQKAGPGSFEGSRPGPVNSETVQSRLL